VTDHVDALRSWAEHVNEYGSLILSFPSRHRRFERKEIKKLLAAADLEEVSIHPYGALGGHAMEFVSNKILKQRAPSIQFNSVIVGKLLAVVALPMQLLQRPFLQTSVGVGWVVVARRKRGAL
jgi:hypothetical protein